MQKTFESHYNSLCFRSASIASQLTLARQKRPRQRSRCRVSPEVVSSESDVGATFSDDSLASGWSHLCFVCSQTSLNLFYINGK